MNNDKMPQEVWLTPQPWQHNRLYPTDDHKTAWRYPVGIKDPVRYLLAPDSDKTLPDNLLGALYAYKTDEADEGAWIESNDFPRVADACTAICESHTAQETATIQKQIERMRIALIGAKEFIKDVEPSCYPGTEQKEYTMRTIEAALNNPLNP